MKKKVAGFFAVLIIFVGFFLLFQVLGKILPKGKGALQITSNVAAKVLLNGKDIGTTPLCKCEINERIDEGTYTVQLIPQDNSDSFITKVQINKGVLTALDRTFLPGSFASSYTLLLEKNYSKDADLAIYSIPSESLVTLDGNDVGVTPLTLKKVSASEHEIELQKGGYGKKTIRLRAVPGYKLKVQALLGTLPSSNEILPGSESSPTPTPTAAQKDTLTILSTPTGFLRVRKDASVNSEEIGRVKPNDTLTILQESSGWFQVQLPDGKSGWISSDFAKKNTSPIQ